MLTFLSMKLINKLEFKNSIIDEFTEKGLINVNMDVFKEALEESKKH